MLFARGACRSPISSEEEETFEKENAELQKTRRKSVKRIKTHQPTSKIIKVSEQKGIKASFNALKESKKHNAIDITFDESLQVAQEQLFNCQQVLHKIDKQKLEIVSKSEYEAILASLRHIRIENAVEELRAVPSMKRDKSRSRRLSKIGRVAARRISLLTTAVLPIIEESEMQAKIPPIKNTEKKPIIPKEIISLVLHRGFVDINTLKCTLYKVSNQWKEISTLVYAWSLANYSQWLDKRMHDETILYDKYPSGSYLSDGAYKEVFKVFSWNKNKFEACSVMDIHAIEKTGNQNVVRQEVAHSILLSDLVESKVSPNFVEIYDIMLSRKKPKAELWGSADVRKPNQAIKDLSMENEGVSGLFQYIHMEYCDGGDLETFIALQSEKQLPIINALIPFLFQMVFSVYCGREKFHLRHCDIKLLNFFLKKIDQDSSSAKVIFQVQDKNYLLNMPPDFRYWVKLADYGTADTNIDSLEQPVTLDQFTTLENTPVEFMLDGDLATQSFASDSFALGLSVLHLFTGCAPYEEIMEDITCPVPLKQDLKRLWTNNRRNSVFTVLKQVVRDDPDDVLFDTLYRYLVLFGCPADNPSKSTAVWNILMRHLRFSEDTRSSRKSHDVRAQYITDHNRYGLWHGCETIIRQARERLEQCPGAREILNGLLSFNPKARPTMKSILLSPLFDNLLLNNEDIRKGDLIFNHYSLKKYGSKIFDV